ncbi:hypothetical protein GOP47_0029217 [Adiantum capillus-veneris]|nr:hypothetical protein GOP47_0029217 [Adiantum capillus-veneris]
MPCPAGGRAQKKHKQLLVVPPIGTNSPRHVNIPALSAVIPPTGKEEDDGQRCNLWLPEAPLVPRPRAHYNAASLAYLGDCIYELYVRCHFLSPPQSIEKYNTLVMGLVCCEAQDISLRLLLKDDFLSEEERDIVRWGKNVQTNHKKATKRAGAAVYSRASSLETLIGYLYLTNQSRLQELMGKLGLTWTNTTNAKEIELEKNPSS